MNRAADNPGFSSLIREESRRLGFFKTGITSARTLPDPEHFARWLNQGFHGEMRYMERQSAKRLNPGLVLPNSRSIIVAAMNYSTAQSLSSNPMKGRISRYALGTDYHETIKRQLELLLQYIRGIHPSAEGRCYVDTGPIMEKIWGAETALGWMGKHTNLITRDRGSWFFIGIILVNFSLEHDLPEKNYCGKCRRCIDACPTGAIVAPYLLDARLCISYLTIELRGPIPVPLRSLIGNRIFGCDDCQEVCPWNRFAVKTAQPEFYPVQGRLNPDLISLAGLTEEEFQRKFESSPVLRATREGFVRNVVVALGNSGNPEAVPALKKALQDGSPLVREHAEWALGRIANYK